MRIRCRHCDAETATNLPVELISQLVDDCEVCGEYQGFEQVETRDSLDVDETDCIDLDDFDTTVVELSDEPADRPAAVSGAAGDCGSGDASGRRVALDRGFLRAVEEEYLTPRQALPLGNRESVAGRLAKRFGLPIELAYDVVDRRVTREGALRRVSGGAPPQPSALPTQRRISWPAAVGAALALGIVMLLVLFSRARIEAQARTAEAATAQRVAAAASPPAPAGDAANPSRPARPPLAEVVIDSRGRVVEVTGPSPRSVLDGWCEAVDPAGRLQPIELRPMVVGIRFGVYQDLADLGYYAIPIRRDRRTRRWGVGDGSAPIMTGAPVSPPLSVSAE